MTRSDAGVKDLPGFSLLCPKTFPTSRLSPVATGRHEVRVAVVVGVGGASRTERRADGWVEEGGQEKNKKKGWEK